MYMYIYISLYIYYMYISPYEQFSNWSHSPQANKSYLPQAYHTTVAAVGAGRTTLQHSPKVRLGSSHIQILLIKLIYFVDYCYSGSRRVSTYWS